MATNHINQNFFEKHKNIFLSILAPTDLNRIHSKNL